MSQIARALMSASEDAIDTVINTLQEEQLRTRKRAANAREQRREIHRNPQGKPIRLTAVAAPGAPLGDVMRKTWFREHPEAIVC